MSTARKAGYAALGIGASAVRTAKDLPRKVAGITTDVAGSLRDPAKVRELVDTSRKRVGDVAGKTRKQATKAVEQLVDQGQTIAKRIQRSAPTKRAAEESKKARSRVKSAARQTVKAAKAGVDAAESAVEKAVEQTG